MSQAAIQTTLLHIAEYYEKELTETQLEMYSRDLAGLSEQDIERAFALYRSNPQNDRFPLPAKLKAALSNQIDDTALAMDLATRICAAIEKKGRTWDCANANGVPPMFAPHATFGEAVVAELGEVAWESICRFGGWRALNDAYLTSDRTAFMAQQRDRIVGMLKMSRAGRLYEKPALPAPPKAEKAIIGPTPVRDILKRLAGGHSRS